MQTKLLLIASLFTLTFLSCSVSSIPFTQDHWSKNGSSEGEFQLKRFSPTASFTLTHEVSATGFRCTSNPLKTRNGKTYESVTIPLSAKGKCVGGKTGQQVWISFPEQIGTNFLVFEADPAKNGHFRLLSPNGKVKMAGCDFDLEEKSVYLNISRK